jgi:mono/diheme cytochrome c family protein
MALPLRKTFMVLTVAVGMAGTGSAWADDLPDEVINAGKSDYMTYCAVCHGVSGVGDGPVARDLIGTPSDLTKLASNNGGTFPEDLAQQVIDGRKELMGHGTRDMPIWGNWFKFVARAQDTENADEVTSEIIVSLRIQTLIEYLKTIQVK